MSTIHCPADVVAGSEITKEQRQEQFGMMSGGAGSTNAEKYQRKKVIEGTGINCSKTNVRINLRTNTLKDIAQPNVNQDGFDYSEDFDGVQKVGNKYVYLNFKSIVGAGGAQTRSLREVYWFVEGQLNVAKTTDNIYFANILDGSEAHKQIEKFNYACSLPEHSAVKSKVYAGDLKGYFDWFKKTVANE
jgi:hypothetical protein